ncbi:hypothetical protein [Smaragdicoccus niigatensis]|uniref:hypothetical protein n=1 Tax=Smaragdicoccus niigatensis TaxID=359359 RepID=UPI00039DC885|nr:hypothetical protein [Smaragdicoccus niigatensis]
MKPRRLAKSSALIQAERDAFASQFWFLPANDPRVQRRIAEHDRQELDVGGDEPGGAAT